ncbi:MAG TPA: tetratricopeptide repeat protein [Verrucomicrobiae bacterium]|nr:tetratricopeptide repeat protein [Verrucomicrobiae bacterium]
MLLKVLMPTGFRDSTPTPRSVASALIAVLLVAACSQEESPSRRMSDPGARAALRSDDGPSLQLSQKDESYATALAEYAQGIRARRAGQLDRALLLWHDAAGRDAGLTNLALGLAHEFLQRGDTNRALANLDRIREQLPDDPLMQLRLAVDFRRTGRPDDAREAAMRALDGEQSGHLAQAVLYDLDANQYGPQIAIDFLRIRAKDNADDSAFWEFVGRSYADILSEHDKLGVKDIAIKTLPLFEAGAALPNAGPALKLKIAQLRIYAEKPAEALPILGPLVHSESAVASDARRLLAAVYAQLGRHNDLIPLLERIVGERPDRPDLLVSLADVYGRIGRRDEMRRALDAARQKGIPLGDLAAMSERHKDWEYAERFLREIVNGPVASPNPYLDLHRLLSEILKRHADSLQMLEQASKRFPASIPLRLAAANAATEMHDFDRALAALAEAEKIAEFGEQQASLPFIWFNRGIVFERKGDLAEAEGWLRKTIGAQPRHHPAMNYLSYTWADRGINLAEALELVQKALELEPGNTAYLDTLGWVYFRLGRLDEALAEVDRALKAEPDEPEILQHRGDILEKLGRHQDARESWEKALKLDPDRATQIRQRLGPKAPAATPTPQPQANP